MQANETNHDLAVNDLGPLAWVLDELRKSLETASSALRRFVRDAEAARGSELGSIDSGQLRIARQQLHQAVGALEMVGLAAPAQVLRSMEASVQKFIERPELCSEVSSAKVERAGFALTDYLEGLLLGKPLSAVALFPQYRDVQELSGADRSHPADLWQIDFRWTEPESAGKQEALAYDPTVRAQFDKAVLRLVKSGDTSTCRPMVSVCLGLAATQEVRQPRVFWKIAAGFFEAMALGLCTADVHIKRAASRILMQYATLARGDTSVSDRLAQDLLFFCAQAVPTGAGESAALTAVRKAFGLQRFSPVNYETSQFGRFDPVLLTQARKRITAAKESWSSLAGGDVGKLRNVSDQFSLVCDSLIKLHPASEPLSKALTATVEATVRAGQAPSAELAMEVATAILYLEAAFQDLDPSDAQLATRTTRLAERLSAVRSGSTPAPLEAWMEELYRRVSDRQTMGSVVSELRGTLGELEKHLDQFFRNPKDKTPLRLAPGYFSQMRGVLSVLGLDQASHAVLRMRDSVEEILVTEIDEDRARAAGTFDKLGNNLGALGFLIDMLSYQPALAKKLFVFDDALGELKPLMGRAAAEVPRADVEPLAELSPVVPVQTQMQTTQKLEVPLVHETPILESFDFAASADKPVQAPLAVPPPVVAVAPTVATPSPATQPEADDEDDLRDIFLEEAREVIQAGQAAIEALAVEPGNVGEQTTLRRAFHTLKGSSRMVGLTEFGEAAWAMEQLLNSWLADQKPANEVLRGFCAEAMGGFAIWVEDIALGTDALWKSDSFRVCADTLRSENRWTHIQLPQPQVPEIKVSDADPVLEPAGFEVEFVEATPVAIALEPVPVVVEPAPVAEAEPALATPVLDLESAEPTLLVDAVPAAEVDFSFDVLPAESPTIVSRDIEQPTTAPAELEAVELEGIDFASLMAIANTANVEPLNVEPTLIAPDAASLLPVVTLPTVQVPLEVTAVEPEEEQVKVIGSLRIGIPLYNVYLNEADERSRMLLTEVTEWSLDPSQPVADSTVGLAHSLAGSSGTVGFHALSELARALEHAMLHSQTQQHVTADQVKAFTAATEDVRRLLHQFAAGFLKEPDPQVIADLRAVELAEFTDLQQDMTFDSVIDFEPTPVELPVAAASAVVESSTLAPPVIETAAAAALVAAVAQVAITPSLPPMAAQMTRVQAAVASNLDIDDEDADIDVVDAVDMDLFPIFEEEAIELMPQLGSALRQWAAKPDTRSARDLVLRALHTLKGSARLAGALRLGELAHRMESEIEEMGTEGLRTAQFDPLLHRFDNLQANFDGLRSTGGLPSAVAQVEPTATVEVSAATALEVKAETASPAEPRNLTAPIATILAPLRAASNQVVRVRSQLLDRMVNQAGEIMITRSRLEAELGQLRGSLKDLSGNLDRLRAQLRDIELQAESQMQSRLALAKDTAAGFDPLEFDRFTRVQELTRMMAESVNDVATVQRNLQRTVEATEDDLVAQARQTRELQRDLLRTRMVEFEGISDRLYRVVRLASKETGKQVRLDITGGSIEMDRGVLDRMTPAFEHLLRNCVAHGIEDAAVRDAAGKDASGLIVIELSQEGNDVAVAFSDDGAGLNAARIREKALSQGLITPDQSLSDADAANLIFMPGFSTATQVTELSGRGIGMDVVRSEVNALGGRIETSTQAGKGTNFKLVLPLTTAVTQVVMLRSGKLSFGVAANVVENVRRFTAKEVASAYSTGTLDVGGEAVPFHWSGALLQASSRSTEPASRSLSVVIFRSAAQRVAVHVDEVLGNQEAVVKNLGPQLSRLPGLAGMTVLASGAVVLIYNPVALATVYGEQARALTVAQLEKAARAAERLAADQTNSGTPVLVQMPVVNEIPLVLVVDDSITVRRVTQRLLQREGYRVTLAADGLQALERLADELPTVVLSDIEMPRMDGFDLARNIRGDARLRSLPIIMITSRIAEKHREHAMELGVNNYLGKPYSEEELLSLVRHYAKLAVPA
jgi:chemosensory pili system protein ChpA (sensor histidine kinase/response regulator)